MYFDAVNNLNHLDTGQINLIDSPLATSAVLSLIKFIGMRSFDRNGFPTFRLYR
jgi:hypothetical protein